MDASEVYKTMKKLICCIICALMLLCIAAAEQAGPSGAALPTPTALPAGDVFSSEDLIVTLPYGLALLDEASLAGYAAAIEDDFPDAGRLLLAAVNVDSTAVLSFSVLDGADNALDAANEAAKIILGDSAAVSQLQYGENSYASFSCGIGEDVFNLYFLAGDSKLLLVGASGVEETQIETMLAGLNF